MRWHERPGSCRGAPGRLGGSRHRGSVAVTDADGASVFSVGEVAVPVFPRSAVKPLQALPLMESGAADRYAFTAAELAPPAPRMVASRRMSMASRACWTRRGSAFRRSPAEPIGRARKRQRSRWRGPVCRRRCTTIAGKHAGFLCAACTMGVDHVGYWRPEHAVQLEVRAVLEDLTGVALSQER